MNKRQLNYIFSVLLLFMPMYIGAKTENRSFRIINAANGLADNSAQTLDCTFSGRIIVSSLGHINIYDGGYFTQISSDRNEKYFPLSKYSGNYHHYFDNNHHLWLKDKRKVKCVDMLTEKYINDLVPLFEREGVKGELDDLFVDSSGRLWLVAKGILVAENRKYSIKFNANKELQDLEVNNDELHLFFSDGSMDTYDIKSSKYLRTSIAYGEDEQKQYTKSAVLLKTNGGFFQIRNGGGKSILLWHEFATGKWSEIMRLDYSLNNMVVKDGMLYIASAYGYWTYDMKTSQLEHYDEIRLNNGRILLTDINTLEFDRQGGFWIGTEKRGLLYSKPRISPFKQYTWENAKALEYSNLMDKMLDNSNDVYESGVYCRYVDSRGWKWKGGRNGVSYQTPGDTKEVVVSDTIGFLSSIANCIIEDNDSNIWIGTSYGIAVILFDNGKIKYATSFDASDNVPIETFTDGRAIKLPDGTIVMQSIDHVVEFNPKTFITANDNFILLNPKFSRLMVNGTVVSAGTEIDGKVIIEDAVSRIRHLNLDYLENTISMTFSALNYFRPLQTYYKVRVLGSRDESWKIMSYFNSKGLVDSKGLLHLPLMGLTPGEYTVEVQASMFPDKWVTPPLRIGLSVKQPWWQTSGVYIFLFVTLAVLAGVNLLFYSRNNRLRIKCNLGEFELTRALRNYLQRCEVFKDDVFMPSHDEIYGNGENASTSLNDKFVDALIYLKPFIDNDNMNHKVYKTVSARNGMSVIEFYDLVSSNVNKNPLLFNRALKLQEAADMLVNTDESIESIAKSCHFVSANYFSNCFLKRYRLTPAEYRMNNDVRAK